MNKDILLLKTSPHSSNDIKRISVVLDNNPQIEVWNIDLEDCDKILRIESEGLTAGEVVNSLYKIGVWSEELLD